MKNLTRVLLWFAVIWAAVWFGGQVFNALMVVPHLSHNVPESLTAWGRMRFDNLADFFAIFSRRTTPELAVGLLLRQKAEGRLRFRKRPSFRWR